MKKVLAALISLIFICFSFTSCVNPAKGSVNSASSTQSSSSEDRIVSYSSLDEINRITGVSIVQPGVMGVTDESFGVISGTIAQYTYTLSGYKYCIRASKDLNTDFSGIKINGEDSDSTGTEEIVIAENAVSKAGKMIINNTLYALIVEDNGSLSYDAFREQALEIKQSIINYSSADQYKALAGNYQDSVSKRATGTIELTDTNKIVFTIEWEVSAELTNIWKIAPVVENGRLSYDASSIIHITSDGEKEEKVEDSEAGYFVITSEGLAWSGSGSEETSQCIFAKIG